MGLLTIAFDDGYKATYDSCASFLADKGIAATFAIPSSSLGGTLENRPVLNIKDLIALPKMGHEVASHSVNHVNMLDTLLTNGENAVHNELAGSKETLDNILGINTSSFVFPFIEANNNPLLRRMAAEYYASARITTEKFTFNRLPVDDPFSITGVAVTKDIPMELYNKLVDIANTYDLWLIEVFHLVAEKNTLSATKNTPYRFFTHIDGFKEHIDYVLSTGIKIVPQSARIHV